MNYYDPVYGPFEIVEPVLLDLMQSQAMRRLQGVLQHGISGLVGVTEPITRYEHSLGAMLLVRRLGGSLKEQVAALIHDVSHTAFSHVIDYVVDRHDDQSYHDAIKADFIAHSDLPETLARHGLDWHDFLHEEDFRLLEQPAPALCADRLDYFFRDAVPLGLATVSGVQNALDHLMVWDGRIIVDDLAAARWIADTFIAADDASWANLGEVGLYELTAQAIKAGLRAGTIDESDFMGTDAELWGKLAASSAVEVRRLVPLISAATQFVWDEANPTWWVSTKIRTVDPDVRVNGAVELLSAIDPVFAAHRQAYLNRKQGLWPIRMVDLD
ncbi:MAG: HD domain-containing protein [Anaerolineae bacterium]|nr:HD domain-containing protein [Anaerolineae bacterium]